MRSSFHLFCFALLCGIALPLRGEHPATAQPLTNVISQTPEGATGDTTTAQADTSVNTVSDARITFAPSDGARFERLLHNQFSVSHNGEPFALGQVRSKILERWEKSGEQWLLHCTPVDVTVEESSASPNAVKFKEILLSQPYTVVFNAQGKLIEVRGFDDFPAKLKEAFGDEENVGVAEDFPAQHRQAVTHSPNYQFNGLYGKRWKAGERYERDRDAGFGLSQSDQWKQINTITAIDPSTAIIAFESNALVQPRDMPLIRVSEQGTATLDTSSGQLRQLQKTHLGEMSQADAEGNRVDIKRTEVLSITWRRVD